MYSFKAFILKESVRVGLPHIHSTTTAAGNQTPSLSTDQFASTTKGGKIHIKDVTEKTDGQTFVMGHDEHGFYTQHSGSGNERIRTGQGHIDRAKKRAQETGKEYNAAGPEAFAKFHDALHNNKALQAHLAAQHKKTGKDVVVRGEAFNRSLATPGDRPGESKFVHTSYSTKGMGRQGAFIIHSKLPENQGHDVEHFKKALSDSNITFDHDIVPHKPGHVDVADEVSDFNKLDHGLINSRTTPKNKAAKLAEIEKFNNVKKRVTAKVQRHIQKLGIKPKFGSGSEGLIVHPSSSNPEATRFKVTSDAFKKAKAAGGRFGEEVMLRFLNFIAEGGNIKVGPKGSETSAAPFPVSAGNRSERRADIHSALGSLHDAFHEEHGEHLFGKDKQGLKTGRVYSGSTHDLMSQSVNDKDFAKHKPSVGDIDTQVTAEHKEKLASTLTPGRRFGKYTVVGTKKHGNEISAVMKHDNGEHHQFDFQGVHNPGSEASHFLHSSNWQDTQAGIKGAHHKILINAVGGDKHKFSITHGLRSRTDDSDEGVQHPRDISHKLFGADADHDEIKSFHGVTQLIKKHIPKERHQEIYDKFKSSLAGKKDMDHGPALAHLRKHLGVKDTANESYINEEDEQHVHVAFMGASPHTHMGHHIDVVGGMGAGKKFVGLSGKSDVFSDKEREDIANKQSNGDAEFKVEKSAGQTVGRAFRSMRGSGKKVLHLHFGHDRKEMAERLKASIEAGKIPELGGERPHRVEIHYPKDENRSHGMSGTKMRTAAETGDAKVYKQHLGPNFSDKEAKGIMDRTRVGLMAGKIKVKR